MSIKTRHQYINETKSTAYFVAEVASERRRNKVINSLVRRQVGSESRLRRFMDERIMHRNTGVEEEHGLKALAKVANKAGRAACVKNCQLRTEAVQNDAITRQIPGIRYVCTFSDCLEFGVNAGVATTNNVVDAAEESLMLKVQDQTINIVEQINNNDTAN